MIAASVTIAMIAAAEAVAYSLRYRAASRGSAAYVGWTTLATCGLRGLFAGTVAAAVVQAGEHGQASAVALTVVYAVVAAGASAGLHAWLERRAVDGRGGSDGRPTPEGGDR